MSWASERCKSQSTSHRSAELSNASLNAAEHRLALPRYVELCHRPPVTIKPALQLLPQVHEPGRGYPRALLRKLLLRVLSRHLLLRGTAMPCFVPFCGVLQVASSPIHRSRFTIKTWPHVC